VSGSDFLTIVLGLLTVALWWALEHWQVLMVIAFGALLFQVLSIISGQIGRVQEAVTAVNVTLSSIEERLGDVEDRNRLDGTTNADLLHALHVIRSALAGWDRG
jgi:hypothetical protein